MACAEQDQIELYVCGKLSENQMADFEQHIEGCADCGNKLQETRENENLLTRLRILVKSRTETVAPPVSGLTVDSAQSLVGNRYRVVRKVGEGSAGSVFQAIDTVLERLIAIKFLSKKPLSDRIGKEIWREARLMGQLNHPNIAQIYEIGELEGQQFIVMEWVDGLPLTEGWKGLQLQQRLRIYLGILDAVAAAHRRGIIHRDIKPSNILVTSELKPKVLDFGIAIDVHSEDSIQKGLYRGTPAYSAPEQITVPVKISPATDVFALGVLLYQLLTDTLPFPQFEPKQLFEAIRSEYPELPSALQEQLPIPLQNICLKALEKEPDKRYSNAQGLSDDINRYLRGEKVWSRPSFLTDKIQQEVFYHRQKLKVWHENELITQREFDKLEDIYEHMITPPDPSIIEARKLSLSQVCLYLGGWIAVLGSFVLFYKTWDQIPVFLRPVPAIIATATMIIVGLKMLQKKELRLSVGFLTTANLLIPITILLTLGQWQILPASECRWGIETVYNLLQEAESYVLVGNLQMYLSAWCWLAFSLVFLRTTRSSIFVIFSIIAFLCWLTVYYVISGMEDWSREIIAGRYLYPGIGLFVLGIVLDRRRFTHYAYSLCIIGLILIIAPLSVIAASDSTFFGWIWSKPQWLDEEEQIALSFGINGLLYLGLATICRSMGTILQRRLALVLNWLGPVHILGSLRMLDSDRVSSDHKMLYRILLPIASFAFVFLSVPKQMKSFFFSGLGGIASSVHKFTTEHLDKFFAWPVSLIIAGIVWMFVSWLVPRWKANLALKRKG